MTLVTFQTTNGLTPPTWNTKEAMDKIVQELIPFQYHIDFGSVERAKLKGGVMVDQIILNMEAALNGDLDNRTRLLVYSGVSANVERKAHRMGCSCVESYRMSTARFAVMSQRKTVGILAFVTRCLRFGNGKCTTRLDALSKLFCGVVSLAARLQRHFVAAFAQPVRLHLHHLHQQHDLRAVWFLTSGRQSASPLQEQQRQWTLPSHYSW